MTAPQAIQDERGKNYKIYHDGSHYVGIKQFKRTGEFKRGPIDAPSYFEDDCVALYNAAVQSGLKRASAIKRFVVDNLAISYERAVVEELAPVLVKKELHKYFERVKRFRRKAYLHPWNYFATFTYDDRLLTEALFQKRLPNCLSHLHARRAWNYMGVWERGELGGRLHFHALTYVPPGQMVGALYEERYYDLKAKKQRTATRNTFFDLHYGRTDFTALSPQDVRRGNVLGYLLKYLQKSGERIIYSRGIPTEIEAFVPEEDILLEYVDYCEKAIISDDFWAFDEDIFYVNSLASDSFWGDIDELPQ